MHEDAGSAASIGALTPHSAPLESRTFRHFIACADRLSAHKLKRSDCQKRRIQRPAYPVPGG